MHLKKDSKKHEMKEPLEIKKDHHYEKEMHKKKKEKHKTKHK